MLKSKKKVIPQAVRPEKTADISEDDIYDNDTSDIDVISTVIGVVLIIVNVAWLIVIAPAIYNTLFPKF